MKESDLYAPVRDWLRSRGYAVHIEIFDCDVVGINGDGHMVAVELKRGMTRELYVQLSMRAIWADEVWAAVPPTADKPNSDWSGSGFGLLIVTGDKIKVQRKACPQPWHWHKKRIYRRQQLSSRSPALEHHVAGLPSCAQAATQRDEVRYVKAEIAAQADGGGR